MLGPESVESACGGALDRAEAAAHRRGGIGLRHVDEVAERHGLALAPRQRPQRNHQVAAAVVERIGRTAAGRVGVGQRCRATGPPRTVERLVRRHPGHPRRRVRLDRAPAHQRPGERLLGAVLGVGAAAEDREGGPVRHPVQLLESADERHVHVLVTPTHTERLPRTHAPSGDPSVDVHRRHAAAPTRPGPTVCFRRPRAGATTGTRGQVGGASSGASWPSTTTGSPSRVRVQLRIGRSKWPAV